LSEYALRIKDVKKRYRLGQIGGTTLKDALRRLNKNSEESRWLAQKYGDRNEEFYALDGVTFDVRVGEAVGIIGHNGAGKSTLLKLISRITGPTEGSIYIKGRVASMLEVGTGFHGELTGRENIYMNGAILGMSKKEIDSKIEDIIDFSECRQFIDTPVKRYSSGMYVKLAFSVAANLDAEIMIMDEVLAVGDIAFQKKCLDKMNETIREEGRTVLYVSHNMNTIRQLCTRCVVLDKGKLIFDGDTEEAIRIYAETVFVKAQTSIDLSGLHRTGTLGSSVKMLHLDLPGRDQPLYAPGEPLDFDLTVQAAAAAEELCLRFEIKTEEGVPVGTFVGTLDAMGSGETTVFPLSVATDQLIPGRYLATPAIYKKNRRGSYTNLDILPRIVAFTVTEYDGDTVPAWNGHAWGRVTLGEIKNRRQGN